MKLFKLCDPKGYTYTMSIYTGQNLGNVNVEKGLAERVVLDLSDAFLDEGRTIVTDNSDASIPLVPSVLEKITYLLGTLRKNRKGLPKDVLSEHHQGFVVAKWNDKREVFFFLLNTTLKLNQREEETKKARKLIYLSIKIEFELLLNTAVVNSLIIHKRFRNKKMQIGEFREHLIMSLLQVTEETKENNQPQHFLETYEERGKDNTKKR